MAGKSASLALAGIVVAALGAQAATVNVSNVHQLSSAISGASPGDEIVLAAGTYDLTLQHGYYITTSDLTIRGATGNRDDVVIYGGGMNNTSAILEGIQLAAPDCAIMDLTLSGFYHHAVHFQNGADRSVVRNVRTLNIGEHHMKGVRFADGGLIEYCQMDQTETRLNGLGGRPDNYGGGIDLIGARNWTIRDNVARDIKCADFGYGDAGIFLWQDIDNATIERNVVIGCNKGIALGNPFSSNGAVNSTVANNFIVRGADVGLELCSTIDTLVANNTIYGADGGYFRAVHIYGSNTSGLELVNNLIRGEILDNAKGLWVGTTNITGATAGADWFANAAGGNLHLTDLAVGAIDAGTLLAAILEDMDTGARTGPFDIGADEYWTPPPGDANKDGLVDVSDLAILAGNYRRSGPYGWTNGDFNRDFAIDIADLAILAGNYRYSAGAAPAADGLPVPEPAALLLLTIGAALLRKGKRQRPTAMMNDK